MSFDNSSDFGCLEPSFVAQLGDTRGAADICSSLEQLGSACARAGLLLRRLRPRSVEVVVEQCLSIIASIAVRSNLVTSLKAADGYDAAYLCSCFGITPSGGVSCCGTRVPGASRSWL